MVNWVRTFPETIPENRNYVVDQIPRIYMSSYDYRVVFEQFTDNTVLLEWDIVVDPHMVQTFEKHIADSPDEVHVAPYLYHCDKELKDVTWIQSRVTDLYEPPKFNLESLTYDLSTMDNVTLRLPNTQSGFSWYSFENVNEGDSWCNWSGLGMIYFPLDIIKRYLAEPAFKEVDTCDATWFAWHYQCVQEQIPLHWDVRPIHLHF